MFEGSVEGRPSMWQSLSDLALTDVRLRARTAHGFNVADAQDPACRARLLQVLAEHSHLAGQFHVLSRDGWRVLWTPDRTAFIPFHDRAFTLVAWRDPVGTEAGRREAMHLFRAYASTVGKHAIVLAASSAMRTSSPLFAAVWIGAEQRLDLATFNTLGRTGEKLRLALNHARRLGLSARELNPRRDVADRRALRFVEDAWKAARPSRRLASFLRTEPLENAEHRRYFGVETSASKRTTLQSFLVCSPVSRRGFYLQDLVRDPGAPRGAAELATVFALDTFRREGLEFATLGITPFFPAGSAPRVGVLPRGADWCIRHFDCLFHFAGLRQFRAKFATAHVDPLYVLHWPRTLTPLAIWDIAALLSGR